MSEAGGQPTPSPARASAAIALLAAASLALVGLVQGTWAVGGSDSSCYALMAEALARGALQPRSALAGAVPWPNAALTLAPAGFIPSPVDPAAASPICAPGFALLLVPFRWIGGADGIFWLTPLAAGALVWSAFLVGRTLGGPVAGAAAALITASSPTVLFQSVQPMNDITAAAFIVGAFAAVSGPTWRPLLGGVMAGLACFVRPNLAPAAALLGGWVLLRGLRPRDAMRFALGAAPAIALALLFNHLLYGHPLRVGYGDTGRLFSVDHLGANVRTYAGSVLETQLAFPVLASLAPLVLSGAQRAFALLLLAASGAIVAVYLLYTPFPEWWYLRFLIPALVLLTACAAAAVTCAIARVRAGRTVTAVVGPLAAGLAAFGVSVAAERQAFTLDFFEARFRHTADVVRSRLPERSVFLSVWESGSLRYHASREAVMWDALDPAWLDRGIDWLQAQEREPFIVVERWEEPRFRQRFGASSPLGALDWPPRFEIDRQVRIFVPADREAYLRGQNVVTEHVQGSPIW